MVMIMVVMMILLTRTTQLLQYKIKSNKCNKQ